MPDPIPEDWNSEKQDSVRRTYAYNELIAQMISPRGQCYVCPTDFEKLAGISKSQGKKKGKALAALDHFEEKDPTEIPADLAALVHAVYA